MITLMTIVAITLLAGLALGIPLGYAWGRYKTCKDIDYKLNNIVKDVAKLVDNSPKGL